MHLFASLDAQGISVREEVRDEPAISQRRQVRGLYLLLVLATVWLLSALYVGDILTRGIAPGDEGLLAQSAERVLLGELPHRDFDELYTGGLSLLNAQAFRMFGVNLASMRYMLYLFFLPWVPCLFFIASRFGPPWMAAAFTALAVAWSVPNYSTGLPSWYNLFFATFGVAALFRYIERRQSAWLFVAGICGGISFLFKLSGLYYVAGAVLFLLTTKGKSNPIERRPDSWSRLALTAFCVLAYEASVFSLLRKAFYPGSFLYFFLPVLAVGVAVVWQQRPARSEDFGLTGELLKTLALFGAGVAIPVCLFLIPYLRTGAVGDFVRGVFVLPGKRLHYTILTESLPRFLLGTAADMAALIAIFASTKTIRKVSSSLFLALAAVVIVVATTNAWLYDAAWVAVWNSLPALVLLGVALLLAKADTVPSEQRQKIFLLLAVTAACNVIQFPYSAPIYFCYVAPLLILCFLGALTLLQKTSKTFVAGLFCASLLFAFFDMTPRFLTYHREPHFAPRAKADFVLPRAGGLRLYGPQAKLRSEMVKAVVQHARGTYIYATPDCPEVYFLSGFRNPTRTLVDFLDEQVGRTQRILADIHAHNVNLVVINHAPIFSGPPPQDLIEALDREFPEQELVDQYEVRWRPTQ